MDGWRFFYFFYFSFSFSFFTKKIYFRQQPTPPSPRKESPPPDGAHRTGRTARSRPPLSAVATCTRVPRGRGPRGLLLSPTGSPPTGRKEGRRRRRRAATPPRLCARRLKQAAALFYFYPSLLICLPLLPSPHRSLLLLLISRESIRIAAIHPLRIYLASYCSLLHYPICRAGAMRYCC